MDVVLIRTQDASLATGMQELEDEHCVVYVALTREQRLCGRLAGDATLELDATDVLIADD